MVRDVEEKSNTGLSCQKQHPTEDSFHKQIGLKVKEETSKVLHLE